MGQVEDCIIKSGLKGNAIPPSKFKYKIGVRVRAMVWPEIVYADNLPDAVCEVTRRLLEDEPTLRHWQTRLISEIDLSTGRLLRKGDGKF